MIVYLQLFFEFFKIGLFAIGGGLATLPFLNDLAGKYSWFNHSMLADMVAVSQATPGPIGINMATYAGFEAAGVLGSIIATVSLVLPSFIIIIIIAHFLNKFRQSKVVNSVFYGLRPAVTGLIAVSGFEIVKIAILTWDKYIDTNKILNLFDYKALILFLVLLILSRKYKKHPIVYLLAGGISGIIFGL